MKRYQYFRIRSDGTRNETGSRKSFEKWLWEAIDGDRFFVGRTDWVECAQDGTVMFQGKVSEPAPLPHVARVRSAQPRRTVKRQAKGKKR